MRSEDVRSCLERASRFVITPSFCQVSIEVVLSLGTMKDKVTSHTRATRRTPWALSRSSSSMICFISKSVLQRTQCPGLSSFGSGQELLTWWRKKSLATIITRTFLARTSLFCSHVRPKQKVSDTTSSCVCFGCGVDGIFNPMIPCPKWPWE